jgi:hypothetical protein
VAARGVAQGPRRRPRAHGGRSLPVLPHPGVASLQCPGGPLASCGHLGHASRVGGDLRDPTSPEGRHRPAGRTLFRGARALAGSRGDERVRAGLIPRDIRGIGPTSPGDGPTPRPRGELRKEGGAAAPLPTWRCSHCPGGGFPGLHAPRASPPPSRPLRAPCPHTGRCGGQPLRRLRPAR